MTGLFLTCLCIDWEGTDGLEGYGLGWCLGEMRPRLPLGNPLEKSLEDPFKKSLENPCEGVLIGAPACLDCTADHSSGQQPQGTDKD